MKRTDANRSTAATGDTAPSSSRRGSGLGESIRAHREALSISQEELAKMCFVSRQTISSWENGKTLPDVQSLTLLADAFGIEPDELLAREEALQIVRSVSADRRELIVLWAAIIGLFVLYLPVDRLIRQHQSADILPLVTYLVFGTVLLGLVARISVLVRRHGITSDLEFASYLDGEIRKGTADRGPQTGLASFARRNYFPISIASGVVFFLVLDLIVGFTEYTESPIGLALFIGLWVALSVAIRRAIRRAAGLEGAAGPRGAETASPSEDSD